MGGRLVVLGAAVGVAVASPAEAVEGEIAGTVRFLHADLSEALLGAQLRYPDLSPEGVASRTAGQLHLLGHVEGRPFDALGLRLGLDSGLVELTSGQVLLDGRSFEERVPETLFLGRTYAELQLGDSGELALRLGKLRPRLGGGAVFDAYAFGLAADLDLGLSRSGPPLSLTGYALLAGGDLVEQTLRSPLLGLEVGWRPSRGLAFALFGLVYFEDDGLAPVINDALIRGRVDAVRSACEGRGCENLAELGSGIIARQSLRFDVRSRGTLGWTGMEVRARVGSVELEGLALLGLGGVDAAFSPDAELERVIRAAIPGSGALARQIEDGVVGALNADAQVSLRSGLLGGTVRWRVDDALELTGFVLGMTGDDGVRLLDGEDQDGIAEVDYGAFVALAPFLPYTSIFFAGGIAHNVASPTVVSLAPDNAGLVAGGMGSDVYLGKRVRLRGVGALMASTEGAPEGGGRLYGGEMNLIADVLVGDFGLAYAEAAVLFPGDYYGEAPTGVQLIAGMRARYP